MVMDFTQGRSATLTAKDAQAGQQATLYVSAPGIAEFPVPIHFVDPIFVPDYPEVRLVSGASNYTSSVSYHMAAYDGGQIVEFGLTVQAPGLTVGACPRRS